MTMCSRTLRPRTALPLAGGLALALLASCHEVRTPNRLGGGGRIGTYDEQTDRAETSGMERPFGQRFERFGTLMKKEGSDLVDDIGHRSEILSEEADRWVDRRGKEWERTSRTLAAVPKAPYVDAALHQDSLGDTLDGTWQRAKRDARTFWKRAWRSLKMLE